MDSYRLRILLVDGHEDDYASIRELLESAEGGVFDLEWAPTYAQGLAAMQEGRHEAYLVDSRLGDAGALELLQAAQASGAMAPIILLSDHSDHSADVAAMKAGAADFLVKEQLSPPLLERAIRHAIGRRQSERALRESETRFRTVVESLGEGLLIADASGVILYANSRVTAMTGYLRDDLIGRDVHQVLLPTAAATEVATAGAVEPVAQAEVPMTRKDGGRLWVLVNVTPFRNSAGGTIGTLYALTDITERKRSQEHILDLIAGAHCLFWHAFIEDRDGALDWRIEIPYPEAAQRLLPLDVRPGENFVDAWRRSRIYDEPHEEARVATRAVRGSQSGYQQELGCRLAHGEIRWLNEDVRVVPLAPGRWEAIGVCTDITEQRRTQEALRESEQRLRFLAETSTDALYQRHYDATRFEYLSPAIYALTGYRPDEINTLGLASIIERTEGDDLTTRPIAAAGGLTSKSEFRADYLIRTKSGQQRWLSDHAVAWRDDATQRVGWVGVLSDITGRKQAETRQIATTAGLQAVLAAADELLSRVDLDGLLRGAVEAGLQKLGIERCGISLVDEATQELIGTYGTDLNGRVTDERGHRAPQPPGWADAMRPWQPGQTRWTVFEDVPLTAWDGAAFVPSGRQGWVAVTPIQTARGLVGVLYNDTAISGAPLDEVQQGIIAVYCSLLGNIIERKRVEHRLERNAFYDGLTGLPNRALFLERLDRAIARRLRRAEYAFAVLCLDLDRFKNVNDSLGHIIGDQLLVAAARRLEQCVRQNDSVARLGGDEFTVLLDEATDVAEIELVAERIQRELSLPFQLETPAGGTVEWFATASIGIALSASGYTRADEVLRDADIAMYRAKAAGKARHEMFDVSMHERARALLQLESDLWRALERDEFLLHYQPIVALDSGALIGFEALVRWQHPERGLVSPGEFVPVIEDTGLIVPVGYWVLREACRQMRAWDVEFPGHCLTMSVNVSTRQFSQADLVEKIEGIVRETGLATDRLRLEITESVIMESAASAAAMLARLKALGVQVSVDDFGTGYSSLSSLHLFPLDTLKIDRSFVQRLGAPGEGDIVETIVLLARNLDLQVVAEGVETDEQLACLKALNCPFGQGYLFARPLNTDGAGRFIADHCAAEVTLRAGPPAMSICRRLAAAAVAPGYAIVWRRAAE